MKPREKLLTKKMMKIKRIPLTRREPTPSKGPRVDEIRHKLCGHKHRHDRDPLPSEHAAADLVEDAYNEHAPALFTDTQLLS